MKKIAFVGGGTGGHIIPILSLVSMLNIPSTDCIWIGGEKSMEAQKAQEHAIDFFSIPIQKLESIYSWKVLFYPFKLFSGIIKARSILKNHSPRLVFSKGGPGSVAVGIAAWTLRIPLYIHESDTIPGFSNRVLGFFAKRIFLGFKEAKKFFPGKKTEVIGQILHGDFFLKKPNTSILWKTKKPHVFVNCGSQGSRKIFQALLQQKQILQTFEWIIVLGTLNHDMRSKFDDWVDVQIFDWIDNAHIPGILDHTDVAITRASATTLRELTTRPLRLIIIPLALSARNHQYFNAKIYEQSGHVLIEESILQGSHLDSIIKRSLVTKITSLDSLSFDEQRSILASYLLTP